jgi:hypothetical protein
MPTRLLQNALRSAAAAVFLTAQVGLAAAQGTVTPVAAPDTAADLLAPALSQAELAQLLAPIALYPDQLVTQILMAAGYPLEVVEADRWRRDPQHAALTGDALAAALAPIDWDPSVKSLVPFPQILAMMSERLDWTRKLGSAFVTQQAEVMDAVQRLRYAAWDTGALRSSDRLTVTPQGDTITITPAQPNIVYVPVYDPAAIYGVWAYPAYPPYALLPAYYTGIGFGVGYVIVQRYWDWQYCDWHRHRIVVDRARVNVINARFAARDQWRSAGGTWSHDPHHQQGQSLSVRAASFGGGAAHVPAPWHAAPARVTPQLAQSNALPPRVAISPPSNIERHGRPAASPSIAAVPPPASTPHFQGAPTTQFRNAPTTQFRNAPTTHFSNAPTTHFQNAPTQFRAAPSASVLRAHVAPSHPAPAAHVAPSQPPSSTTGDHHHH